MSKPALFLLAALFVAGCGRAPIGTAMTAKSGTLSAKFSADELARYRGKIERMVAYYDKNHDGAIGTAESPVKYGEDRTYVDERFNRNWILRTEITYDLHRRVKSFLAVDGNDDGRATANEVVDAYLRDRDTNGDDGIGVWERMKAVVLTPSARFETKWYQETGRRQYFVWSPQRPNAIQEAPPSIPEGWTPPPLKVEIPEE